MAYNKTNLLIKALDVQTIYMEHSKRGATAKWIYTELVFPKYKISRATFYNYLATNAKLELKIINEQKSSKKIKVK